MDSIPVEVHPRTAWIYNCGMPHPALPHAGGSGTHAHYAHQLLLSDGARWQVEIDGVSPWSWLNAGS